MVIGDDDGRALTRHGLSSFAQVWRKIILRLEEKSNGEVDLAPMWARRFQATIEHPFAAADLRELGERLATEAPASRHRPR